jgi:hypothetical protein
MSRRNKILLMAGLAVVILILLLLFFLRGKTSVNPQPVTTPNPASTPAAQVSPEAQQAAVAQKVQNAGIETVAKLFAERYGSYSTEAQFQNIRDVLPIASASYAAQLQAQIASAKEPTAYYGVTTVVLSVTVDQMDDAAGTGHATVSTQRTESKGSPQDKTVSYQKLVLTFVKEGGQWKVDSSKWE